MGPRPTEVLAAAAIIVLEDDFEFGQFLAALFRQQGFSATNATTFAEARWHLEQKRIDLVISDLNMRGVDGVAVIRDLRGSWPDVPIIAMTAFPSADEAARARNAGAADYLIKPVDWREMLVRINRVLGRG